MILSDDRLQCEGCGNTRFIEEEQLEFHRTVKRRQMEYEKTMTVPHMRKYIVYKCAKCGKEADL